MVLYCKENKTNCCRRVVRDKIMTVEESINCMTKLSSFYINHGRDIYVLETHRDKVR